MKIRTFITSLILIFALQLSILIIYSMQNTSTAQDAVAVNEAVHSIQQDWNSIEDHKNLTNLDYVVLDTEDHILFQTKPDLSQTIHTAIIHRDTILNLEKENNIIGKIIIYNDTPIYFQSLRKRTMIVLVSAIITQFILCTAFFLYLKHTVIQPFQKLKDFATRIAGGNLDIPLVMDRQNLFGAFTEAFDLMRTELKKAQLAEAKANESKKELVAKLSHDIKTPIASIKAVSEVGIQLTDNEKLQNYYIQIIRKADQINSLISNLFSATLEELSRLTVTPEAVKSSEIKTLLDNADYLHHAVISDIPDCLIYADRLRLQQVFDNIFANSYKYANTDINVTISLINNHSYDDPACRLLAVCIEDYGGGVNAEELPLLKEKFKRGSNIKNIEGAGLGLYISDYFIKEMYGKLIIDNGMHGFKASIYLALI